MIDVKRKNFLLCCYSVSQARILKAFIESLPEPADITVISFNDGVDVNQKIALEFSDIATECKIFDAFIARVHPDFDGTLCADNRFLFEHPYTDMLMRQVQAARLLLAEVMPDIVIVVEDGPGGCDPIIKAANRNKIPVVIMPFGVGEFRDYEIFIDQKHKEGALNEVPDGPIGDVLKEHAAKWILESDYGAITLFPADFVLGRISAGLDLPNPWLVQGGSADVLLAESKAMQRIFTREGVPVEKQKLVGSIYADIVYRELQKSEYLARTDRGYARILLSLPPSYHDEKSRITELDTYQKTIEKMVSEIRQSAPQCELIVSLHPAAAAEITDMIKGFGVEISDRWILEEIGRNDIFISTFSSTTRWALAAKKYVLNYDMYNFNLPTYDTVPNFFSCTQIAELAAHLDGIVKQDDAVMARHQKMFDRADEWGMMDGRNAERIWDYLNDLIKGRP